MAGLALAGLTTLSAGEIQIGGVNGLTSNYILAPNTITASNSTGCAGGVGNCVNGSTTGWAERGYITSLFSNATPTNTVSNGTDSLGNGVLGNQGASTPAAWSMTDADNANTKFSMVNDGANNNFFASQTSGTQSITIPVGVANVDKVSVLLNDYWGYAALAGATIDFNFSSTAPNSASPNAVDAIALSYGNTGPLRSTMDCTAVQGTGVSCPGQTTNGLGTIAGGPDETTPQVFTSGNATIDLTTIFAGNYQTNSSTSAIGPYTSTTGTSSGNVNLDDLAFTFSNPAYVNDYLVSITIQTNTTVNSTGNSRLALSAITVDTATPEPSTLLLLLAGVLGMAGFGWNRRRKLS